MASSAGLTHSIAEDRYMSATHTFRTFAVCVVAALAIALPPAAQAGNNYYDSFRVTNPTDTKINYEVKWGADGEWKPYSVEPGYYYQHTWEYEFANQGSSPTPYIRYDNIGGNDRFDEQIYKLEPRAVPSKESDGKRYYFEYASDGRLIKLLSVK